MTGQGRGEEALAALGRAADSRFTALISLPPVAAVDPRIELPQAQAQVALGLCKEAETTLDRVVDFGMYLPGCMSAQLQFQVRRAYGLLCVKRGRTKQALSAYRRAYALLPSCLARDVETYPINPESLDELGTVGAEYAALLRQAGRGAEAARVEAIGAKAGEALKFTRDGLPCAAATRAALWDYLGALRAEKTLREHLRETAAMPVSYFSILRLTPSLCCARAASTASSSAS